MKKTCSAFLTVLFLLCSGCATIEKPKIEKVPESPQISKTIQHQNISKKGLKRKIAIARFTNETKYGQSFFIDQNNDKIGKQAVDILSAKLMETDKFILLERADLEKINKELKIGDYSPLKNMANYLIIGSVSEFGRKEEGKVGIFSRTKKQIAYAKVHVRLVDVATGEVIYAEEGKGESFSEAGSVFGVGARAGYDSSINDKALDAAITDLSSNIIENLLDRPWRSYILGYEDGKILIAGGKSQNITPGEKFVVLKQGKKIKNPQNGMWINLPGKRIATIESFMSIGETKNSELTFCNIKNGSLKNWIDSNDFSNLYIEASK